MRDALGTAKDLIEGLKEEVRRAPEFTVSRFVGQMRASSRKDGIILKMGVALDEGADLRTAVPGLMECLDAPQKEVRSGAFGLLARYYIMNGDSVSLRGLLARRDFHTTNPALDSLHRYSKEGGDISPYANGLVPLMSDATENAVMTLFLKTTAAQRGCDDSMDYLVRTFNRVAQA